MIPATIYLLLPALGVLLAFALDLRFGAFDDLAELLGFALLVVALFAGALFLDTFGFWDVLTFRDFVVLLRALERLG